MKENDILKDLTWNQLLDALMDLVFIQDIDFQIIYANKAFLEAMGLKKNQVIGKKCYEVVHQASTPWCNCPFEKTKQDHDAHKERVDDPMIGLPLLITTSPIFNKKGKLLGSIHVAQDIKELKENEEQLSAAKEYAEKLFETMPNAAFTVDVQCKITAWNKKAEEMIGYTKEEIIGKECRVFAEEPCDIKCGLYEAETPESVQKAECVIKTKNNKRLTVLRSAEILKDNEGNTIGGVESFEDISKRKTEEHDKQEQLIGLEKMNSIMVGRELRMAELKEEIKDLKTKIETDEL